MANRFLNNIKINDSYTLPPADGTADQIIKTDGLGELSFVDQGNIVAGEAEIAKTLQVTVKNVSGGELTKGTVVHVSPSANPPSGNIVEVIAADYDDATKMPAVGILKETIANEAEGEAVMAGALSGIATDGFTAGDELYVGADGALTNAKPQTAGQLIQKIAVCVKSHASNGLIKIFGAGRSNDVPLPLYIDNTNQHVGIGTDIPGSKLEVAGNSSFALLSLKSLNGGSNDSFMKFYDESNGPSYSVGLDSSDQKFKIAYATDGDSLTIGTKLVMDTSGNVGIGTTSPSTKLHVIGDSNSSRAAIFESTSIYGTGVILKNGSNGYGRLAQDGNNLVIHNSTEDGYPIIFSTTPGVGEGAVEVERMRIDGDNGNVGIGTTSPGKLLELKGGDNEAVLRLFNDQANTWDIQNSTLGKLDFIRGSSNTYMRIDQNGNVGIGTTSPLTKLHTDFSTLANGDINELVLQSKANGSTYYSNSAITGITFTNWINGYTAGSLDRAAGIYGYNADTAERFGRFMGLSFYTSSLDATATEKMRIDHLGNVGIGTDNPAGKLEVRQDANNGNGSAFTNPHVKLTASATADNQGFVGITTATSTANNYGYSFGAQRTSGGVGDFKINYHNNSAAGINRFLIDQNGNVGIGTTGPSQKLSVAPDTDVSAEIGKAHIGQVGFNDYAGFSHVDQNTQQGYALIQYSDGSTYMNANTGKNIRFRIGNSDKMILNSSGNVGIGTTAPSHPLTIVSSYPQIKIQQTGQTPYFTFGSGSGFAVFDGVGTSGGLLDIRDDGTSRIRIDSLGNVGIGTTSPSQKLHVSGSALVTSNLYIYSTSYYLGVFFGRIDLQAANGLNVRSGTTYKPVYASAFTVSSDYRLKSNIVPLENAISRVNQLEVHRFNWNDRLNEPKVDGFIAHEVATVIPEAVLGEKDAMHEDGTPNHQGIDQSKIVPLLTAALQEAIAKIESLESRIQTLENQ